MKEQKCLYEVLGVARDATPEQIKKAFYAQAKKWHPDRNPDNRDECSRRTQEIIEAYEILKDPDKRAGYDKHGFAAFARDVGTTRRKTAGGEEGPSFEDLLRAMFLRAVDLLIDIARREAVLFHTPDDEPYADVKIGGHRETYHVRSGAFERWLRHRFFRRYEKSANANAMAEALATITMFAICDGPEKPVHVRIGAHAGNIYIDIGDKSWQAVEVTPTGWKVVNEPPIRFERSSNIRALPIPKGGGSIEALREFVNVRPTDEASGADDFVLLVAYALATLRPDSNYPVLGLNGEQGAGKSSVARYLATLIDPRSPLYRTMPRDERDLIVAARSAHFLSFDNISGLSDDQSDALCRLSTGGGHGERQLCTNKEEIVFEGRRPICLNGIEGTAERADLVDRTLLLMLSAIDGDRRRKEEDIDKDFAIAAPAIFGALMDGMSGGLRNLDSVKLSNMPRMADFATWAEACTRVYWPEGTFMRAYRANIAAANEVVIEASPVGDVVRSFMANRTRWEGTASALLPLLTEMIPTPLARERVWPKNARALSGKLRRAAPSLRKVGIDIAFAREGHGHDRTIIIAANKIRAGNFASAPSAEARKSGNGSTGSGLGADAKRTQTVGADANDGARTQGGHSQADFASASNSKENNGFANGADGADAKIATLDSGEGPVGPVLSDFDAVLQELAARGELNGTCAQCHAMPDGSERACSVDGRQVWLHPECEHFYRKTADEEWR
jgi:DnaJ domain